MRRQPSEAAAGGSPTKGESPAELALSDILWDERQSDAPAAKRSRPRADGPAENADVPDADPESVARTILLRRLDAAPRTRKELADDLKKRAVPDDVAERVLDRFVEVGLIDDAAYARAWVASRQRTRGTARPVLRQELRRKGIDDELIAAALAEVDPDDEAQRARELVARKLPSLARFDRPTQQRRLISMLVRRGYGQGVAYGIVREQLAMDDDTDSGALNS